MTINVSGDNVHDIIHKLGANRQSEAPIQIRWRASDDITTDFIRVEQTGCIVETRRIPGEEVPRCFTTAGEAVKYIAKILKLHEDYAKKQRTERAKKERQLKGAKR